MTDRTWTYINRPTSSVIRAPLLLCIPFIGSILAILMMMSQTIAVTERGRGAAQGTCVET